jgi:hypothetical protein
MTSINQHIFDHAEAEIRRLRSLNSELLEALQVIVKASDLEVAQSIASSAIAIAIARDER